jgi:hypothetical protein
MTYQPIVDIFSVCPWFDYDDGARAALKYGFGSAVMMELQHRNTCPNP